jgi:hypothetical protein
MSLTLTRPPRQTTTRPQRSQRNNPAAHRRNWLGGLAGWLWLAIVAIPLYWVLITSFKVQATYYASNPMAPPSDPTLGAYRFVLESGFVTYFVNSVVATAGAVVPAVLVSFMAAYAIVRGWQLRFLRLVNGLFLMGLAIPLQATVIPIYLIIIKLRLYDSLMALILPSIAFAIPLSVLVLANFIRDVPKELFEAMRIDGATEWMSAPCRSRCGASRASTASTCRPSSPPSSSPRSPSWPSTPSAAASCSAASPPASAADPVDPRGIGCLGLGRRQCAQRQPVGLPVDVARPRVQPVEAAGDHVNRYPSAQVQHEVVR